METKAKVAGVIYDYWKVKLNESGTKLWDRTYSGEKYDGLSSTLATSDGHFLLGGTSRSDSSGDKSEDVIDCESSFLGIEVKTR